MSLICLSGIDGSGKTAHARRILFDLEKNGVRCRYIWFGTPYFLSYFFMTACRLLGLTEVNTVADGTAVSEHEYYKNRPVALVWPWVQLADLLVLVPLSLRLQHARLQHWTRLTLICDRFVPDTLVEVMADVRDARLPDKLVGRLILRTIPHSATMIFLDIAEETAARRKLDVPHLKYLTLRRRLYRILSNYLDIQTIYADGQFSSVHNSIMQRIDALAIIE